MPMRFPRYADPSEAKNGRVSLSLIHNVISGINKEYKGKRELTTLGNSVFATPRSYIKTGISILDEIACFGFGLPAGIIEIYGPESSGKSALLEKILAESQRNGYYTIIFPQEFSLDYRRVITLGLNEEQLVIGDAETIEEVYSQLKKIVNGIRKKDKTTPIVIGWDSVASTPTRSELDNKKELEGSDMGKAAAQISKLFRRLVKFLFANDVCLICINQTRTDIAKRFGNKETTYGGKALRFYSWIRIRLTKIKDIKGRHDRDIGFLCKAFIVKNKVAPPHRECILPIYWKGGIDPVMSVWEYATENKVFKQKGTRYKFRGYSLTRRTFHKFYNRKKSKIDQAVHEAIRLEDLEDAA